MAEISSLLTLQGQLALLTLIGFFLARKGIINAQGRKCLTDLLINVILPEDQAACRGHSRPEGCFGIPLYRGQFEIIVGHL